MELQRASSLYVYIYIQEYNRVDIFSDVTKHRLPFDLEMIKKKKKRKFHMGSKRKDWKISTIRYRCNAYGTEISRFGRIVIDKEFLSEGKRPNKLYWNERDLGFVKHAINLISRSLYWDREIH